MRSSFYFKELINLTGNFCGMIMMILLLIFGTSAFAQKKGEVRKKLESKYTSNTITFGKGLKGKFSDKANVLIADYLEVTIGNENWLDGTQAFIKPGTYDVSIRYNDGMVMSNPVMNSLFGEDKESHTFEKGKYYTISFYQSSDKQNINYLVNEVRQTEYQAIISQLKPAKPVFKKDIMDIGRFNTNGLGSVSELFGNKQEYMGLDFFSPKISPDGKKMALPFSFLGMGDKGSNNMLALVNQENGEIQEIVIPRGEKFTDFFWLPDGSGIIYTYRNRDKSQAVIKKVDLTLGLFLPEPLLDVSRISYKIWDPLTYLAEKNRLYFAAENAIYECDMTTKKIEKILEGGSPVISPSKKELLYVQNNEFYLRDITTGKSNRLPISNRPLKADKSKGTLDYPAYSPDGSKIAFRMYFAKGKKNSHYGLFIMDKDGSNLRELIVGAWNVNFENPVWSDNKTLFFEADNNRYRKIVKYILQSEN